MIYDPPDTLLAVFRDMAVYKSAQRSKTFATLSIPSYLRDWLVMRFADDAGQVDMEEVQRYIRQTLPRRADWEAFKGRMVSGGERIRFLTKLRVEIDVTTGRGLFRLPALGFPRSKYEAVVDEKLLHDKREELLRSDETWGVVELQWRWEELGNRREEGRLVMTDYQPFRPYKVDLDYYQSARSEFTLEEWVDVLLMAVDYNPSGFLLEEEKLTLLTRLLPFVEKRLNLIELAPKGTGKSYVFQQISKYGWLVSGGKIGRPSMFYNRATRAPGLVSRYDYVALDEIQSIVLEEEEEMRGALKGYMENGEYRIGDQHGVGEAGIVLLGNIDIANMNTNANMFIELPQAFHESALSDRFHGFIQGWRIPRMQESMKAEGWGLNTEYTTEIWHHLRDDVRYRAVVDALLRLPVRSDTRDTEAIKRLCTAWLKLLFPNAIAPEMVDLDTFDTYCLQPAIEMRGIIRKQLHLMDAEYTDQTPDITCARDTVW